MAGSFPVRRGLLLFLGLLTVLVFVWTGPSLLGGGIFLLLLAGYAGLVPGLFILPVRLRDRVPVEALCRLGLLLGEGVWVATPRRGRAWVVATAGKVPFAAGEALPKEARKESRLLRWKGRPVGWWGVRGRSRLPFSTSLNLRNDLEFLLAQTCFYRQVSSRPLARFPSSLLRTLPCPVVFLDDKDRLVAFTEEAAARCPGLKKGARWEEAAGLLPEGIKAAARPWGRGRVLYLQPEISLDKERYAAMGQMAAMAAHEIRNPLTAIQGFLQLLQKDLVAPHHKEYLRIALEEMERIAHLTQDMLLMVRQPQEEGQALLGEGVQAAWEILRPLAEAGGHRLQVDIPDQAMFVPMTERHLRQVLLNLFRNALEAMPRGGRVRVQGWCRHGEMGFTVEDEGEGIPPEDLGKVFSPLYTTKKGGTGLGLPIVGILVQMSGGRIEVAPLPQGGTAFTLSWSLPAGAGGGPGRYNQSYGNPASAQ
ncbi:MAG: HAMP domain-containing sensor histidine kinase [Bacillota bacterium]|nr:HAMP domain-containing sensor histidine kinase [Bacillota bacterium]